MEERDKLLEWLADDYNEVVAEVRFNMSTIGLKENSARRVVKARDLAIKALEKQIPKKVVNKEKVTTPEDAEAYGADALFGECPVCNLTQSSVWNNEFCGDCGQRLDWSEESEE